MESLETAAGNSGPDTVIAAHSLGCLLAAHWLLRTSCKISGVLLVAVPDPEGPNFPKQAAGFAPVPGARFACAGIVVASTDDPYSSLEFSRRCANRWGGELINIGAMGHINAASGLGSMERRASPAPPSEVAATNEKWWRERIQGNARWPGNFLTTTHFLQYPCKVPEVTRGKTLHPPQGDGDTRAAAHRASRRPTKSAATTDHEVWFQRGAASDSGSFSQPEFSSPAAVPPFAMGSPRTISTMPW
jgi:pimeloyl-ACP methyl ester carboxylesterase